MWLIETTDTFDVWFDALDDTDKVQCTGIAYRAPGKRTDVIQALRRYG